MEGESGRRGKQGVLRAKGRGGSRRRRVTEEIKEVFRGGPRTGITSVKESSHLS